MGESQIKIIPLLVLVAMMAFSVRLIDFSLGVSSFGAAHAEAPHEEKKMDEPPPIIKESHDSAKKMSPEDSHDKKMDTEMSADISKEMDKPQTSKWRDAKDEDVGTVDIRDEFMDSIAQRHKMLEDKQRLLTTREALLRASRQELDQKYKELLHLRTQIEELLGKQSEEEKRRITSLVKIYEGMKPKSAAKIFNTLDLDVLVSILSRMSERKLSPILASMNDERARTVTIMLAEEKQLPTLPR